MKRNEFVGEGKMERIKDPEIQPKQRWKAVNKHDFGNGPVDYYISIAFKDPMSKLWICNYGWAGNNLMFNQASMYVAKLSTEEITKNFEIDNTPQTINVPITTPNQWGVPYLDPNPGVIYRNAGGTNDYVLNNTFTTSSAGGQGSIAIGEFSHATGEGSNSMGGMIGSNGYVVGDGVAGIFNFADHIHVDATPKEVSPIS